jgi:hypothetical protein
MICVMCFQTLLHVNVNGLVPSSVKMGSRAKLTSKMILYAQINRPVKFVRSLLHLK